MSNRLRASFFSKTIKNPERAVVLSILELLGLNIRKAITFSRAQVNPILFKNQDVSGMRFNITYGRFVSAELLNTIFLRVRLLGIRGLLNAYLSSELRGNLALWLLPTARQAGKNRSIQNPGP